jgi:hypothetical protein
MAVQQQSTTVGLQQLWRCSQLPSGVFAVLSQSLHLHCEVRCMLSSFESMHVAAGMAHENMHVVKRGAGHVAAGMACIT